jgi:subtilisin family serine protease
MTHPFVSRLKLARYCHAFLFMFVITWSQAQTTSNIEPNVFRIKVSPTLASQLEQTHMNRNANNNLVTGIKTLDNVHQRFSVNGLKRVFAPAGKFEQKHRKHGLHLWYEVSIDQKASVLQAIEAYRGLPQILISEPVHKMVLIDADPKSYKQVVYHPESNVKATLPGPSNDPRFTDQWHYNNTGQTGGKPGADISLVKAWGIETGKSDVVVAVIDEGAQYDHPDLAANMWVNADEIPGNGVDDDNNGYIDDIHGYGFVNDGPIPVGNHGTHTSGTVAAVSNNGVGVAGVAGGSGTGDGVRIMSCAVFGNGTGGGFVNAFIYAADNGAVISQNSWGARVPDAADQAVLDAIDYFIAEAGTDENGNQVGLMKGGIAIFSAGNSNTNGRFYPGAYEPTLSVSSTNHKDIKASYSTFGDWVDIAAPGGETGPMLAQGVLSTLSNNQYGYFQGTSMACPHVSGVAALVVSKFGGPGFTPEILRDKLIRGTDYIDPNNPTFKGALGAGRLNAFAALQQDDHTPPDAILDLTAVRVGIHKLTLKWTTPSDPSTITPFQYAIRYSTQPITASNFDSATVVPDVPRPFRSGVKDSILITGLLPSTVYYFAMRSSDFFGHTSAISNVAQLTTDEIPSLVVTPESLRKELFIDYTATETLTVQNTGTDTAEFFVDVSVNIVLKNVIKKTITIPARAITSSAIEKMPGNKKSMAQEISITALSTSSTIKKVLILSPDNDVSDIQTVFNGFPDVKADILPKASLPGISLATLAPYEVVFVTNNTPWLASGGVSAAKIGDLLADYADRGGKVITNNFVHSFDDWKLEGRFMTEQYGPFLRATAEAVTAVIIGERVIGHPVFEGVTGMLYVGEVQNVKLAQGATELAKWSDGQLFLAAKDNVVSLNLLASRGNGEPFPWYGSVPTLYHNIILWMTEIPYVKVNPLSAVVAPGDEASLQVTFNSNNMKKGTYNTMVNLKNDNKEVMATSPVTLEVLGQEFTVEPDTLFEELEKNKTVQKTFVINNNGMRDVVYSIQKDSTASYLTVSPVSGILHGKEALHITVEFNTDDIPFETYLSTIRILVDQKPFSVVTKLRVLGDPEIEVNPTVLQTALEYHTDTTRTLTLKNIGGNPLNYSLQVIGVGNDQQKISRLIATPVHKTASQKIDKATQEKLSKDVGLSKKASTQPKALKAFVGIPILTENFEGAIPSAGWSVTDEEGTGVIWKTGASYVEANYCSTGEAATVSSDRAGMKEYNTSLITPTIDITRYRSITVQYNASYQNYSPTERLDVDIQTEGSSSWVNILQWKEDHGTFRNQPGEFVSLVLDQYLAGATKFKLRWHYYNSDINDYDWYAQIDDVVILGESREWLSIVPASGTIPVASQQEISVNFSAKGVEKGFYVAGILVNSNAAQHPLVGVVASLEVAGPPTIAVAPSSLHQDLYVGNTAEQIVTVTNSGESSLTFTVDSTDSWLSVTPSYGAILPGQSIPVTVLFDATNVQEGVYRDSLKIHTNDPARSLLTVPVTLAADYNSPPVLGAISDLKLYERQLSSFTFSATDEDDSIVTVSLQNLPMFIKVENSGNGFATYKFNPAIGDDGMYSIPVIATDGRGATNTDTLNITVVRLAVTSFSLVNSVTGEVISEFTGAITINKLEPDFANYVIRAKASPDTVGSVKFTVDGKQINIANTVPYQLVKTTLAGLSVGDHTIIGEPFTLPKGHGLRGRKIQAVITILNARIIKDFWLVNSTTGAVVKEFTDSLTVNTTDPDFATYTIQANTSPAKVGSVKFTLDGSQKNIANDVPYQLKKESLQLLTSGDHAFIGEPFSERAGHGDRGVKKNAVIRIANTAGGKSVASRLGNVQEETLSTESTALTIHPVPVTDKLHVTLFCKENGPVQMTIINVHGQRLHTLEVDATQLKQYPINIKNLNMSKGMYYLIVQRANGLRMVQKFIKE